MKLLYKALIGAVLFFMIAFTVVGYAALTTELTVQGTAKYVPSEGIYIINVEPISATVNEGTGSHIAETTSAVFHISGSANTTVTYKITVLNNTDIKYGYIGPEYLIDSAYNGNAYLGNGVTMSTMDGQDETYGAFDVNDTVEPHTLREFYVKFTVNREAADMDLKMLINFKFGIHADSAGDAAVADSLDKFEEILNTKADYDNLITKIDGKEDRNYVGNVNGGFLGDLVDSLTNQDSDFIQNLFDGSLTLTTQNPDGGTTTVEISAIIQKKDVDGDGIDEMLLFMTDESIYTQSKTAENIRLAIFKQFSDGEWIQYGDVYVGKATAVRYNTGKPAYFYNNSFNPDTWVSYATTYQITDGYSYGVAANSTIESIATTEAETEAWVLLNNLYLESTAINLDQWAASDSVKTALNVARNNAKIAIDAGKAQLMQPRASTLIQALDKALKPFR